MNLYYQDEMVTLYCGDCMDVLPLVEADLLVTDPPYGVEYQSNRRQEQFDLIANDKPEDIDAVTLMLDKAIRRIGRGRHIYIFGKPELDKLPVSGITELVWDKCVLGMGDLASPWGVSTEPIQFGTYELSAANRAKGYGNLAARVRKGNVLRVQRPTGGSVTRHPTEKPVMLLRQLIESSSVMGEVVLDPFAGCGSTLVAAKLEGRKAVGVELVEEYCRIAAQRLKAVTFQDAA